MTITLTTFVPGTKAKADEVNANFSALNTAITEKAQLNGDSTQTFLVADATSDEHAVNQGQLNDLSDNLADKINKTGRKFCVKSGNTTDGKGDLFSYSGYEITTKIAGTYDDLVIADYAGNQTTFSSAPDTLSLAGNANGKYNIFINSDGELYILNNTIYKQVVRPTMVVNDIWLDTSVEPFKCVKYSGSSDITFSDVPLGKVTFQSNAITAIETFSFNQNGYDINIQSPIPIGSSFATSISDIIIPDYANAVSKTIGTLYTAESNGYLCVYASANSSSTYLYIDNFSTKVQGGSGAANSSSALWVIGKDSTYKLTGSGSISFIPMKGL